MRNGLTYINGNKMFHLNGKLHRIGKPAIECVDGHKSWWVNGKRHRIDGPAAEYPNGNKEWWVNGKYIECSTQEEFDRLIKLSSFW